jgi:PHD/YefM family antitoxin component YafN of YafNO toxin-antitoxin module
LTKVYKDYNIYSVYKDFMKKKVVSSTYLTQNTREALSFVRDSNQPLIIKNYKNPVAVMLDYEEWLKLQTPKKKRLTLKQLEKYMIGNPKAKKIDSAKIIRKMRDEE